MCTYTAHHHYKHITCAQNFTQPFARSSTLILNVALYLSHYWIDVWPQKSYILNDTVNSIIWNVTLSNKKINQLSVLKCVVWRLEQQKSIKGPVCRISRDLRADMEYNIHNYVSISISPETQNHCVFLTLQWACFISTRDGSSSTGPWYVGV